MYENICYHGIHMLDTSIMPLEHKGPNPHHHSHVALIAQFGEHCTGNALKGRGFKSRSKPEIFFNSFFQSCYGCIRIYHHV